MGASILEQLALDIEHHREIGLISGLMLESMDIVIAGAYKGETIAAVRLLHPDSHIFGFEPQPWAFDQCVERFDNEKDRDKVHLFQFGLGVESGHFYMGEWGTDACSLVMDPAQSRVDGRGELVEASEALQVLSDDLAGLLLLNIEGYEYPLIEHLADLGMLQDFQYILVQLHKQDAGIELTPAIGVFHELIWSWSNWQCWKRVV